LEGRQPKQIEILKSPYKTVENAIRADNENKEKEVEKGAKKDKLITFNIPAEDAEKYKMWFGSKGISMSMGLRMCLDYIYYQDQIKNVVLTKSGIRENALNLLK
jgi:hypothetical protein